MIIIKRIKVKIREKKYILKIYKVNQNKHKSHRRIKINSNKKNNSKNNNKFYAVKYKNNNAYNNKNNIHNNNKLII